MSATVANDLLVPISAAALRLGVSRSTVARLIEDEALQCVRQRSRRRVNPAQIDYVIRAVTSGRSGSVEGFALEWLALQQDVA